VYSHGLDEAPAKVLTAGTISKLAAAHLAAAATSEPPTPTTPEGATPVDPRTAAEAELKKKLAARALECLKNIPDAHGGGAAAAAAGRLGGGVKRLGKPLSAVPKKSHRGGGSGESGGDSDDDFQAKSDDDFQAKKKKHKKGDAVNGKGAPAAGRSEPSSTGKFRQIKVDETLTLLHPGSHLPKAAAFRPRDGAAPGGADGRVGRLDYPVGYVSVAQWNSKKWRCEIVEAGDRPNFRVTADDGSGRPFKSAISPSDVWRQVAYDREVQLFGASGGPSRAWDVSTVDGVALFGLDREVVRREIAGLPSKAPPASAAAPQPKQLPRPAAAAPPPKVPRRPPGSVPKPGKDAQR